MAWLRRLDRRGRLSLSPNDGDEAAGAIPAALRPQLAESVACVTPAGEIYWRSEAVRVIFRQFPVLRPIVWVLSLPIVDNLADRAYRWVSRHRYLIQE